MQDSKFINPSPTPLLLRLKIVWVLLRLSRTPEKTELVFDLADLLYKTNAFQAATEKLSAIESFKRLGETRKLMPEIDLNSLAEYPEGTLGQVYAKHMLDRKLSPDFYRSLDVVDDKTWTIMWFRQTHDLWHVVTGFDTDPASEIGLQAFMMTQILTPLSSLIVGISLIKAVIKDPAFLGLIIENIVRGVTLAKSGGSLVSYEWDLNWMKPLTQVRAELGLAV